MAKPAETLSGLRPYPAYKPSGVKWLGDVPVHWDVRRFKQVSAVSYGDSLPNEARRSGSTLVFGSNGPVGFHNSANTTSPCLVIGRKGSFGKVNYSSSPVFAIDTTFFIDARSSLANLRWIYYLLGQLCLDQVTKDSAIPGLDREDVYASRVPVPPLAEQAAIARYLDEADQRIRRCIQAKEKLVKLLEEQRQALVNEAVTGRVDVRNGQPYPAYKPSGVEWLAEVPTHWRIVRNGQIFFQRNETGFPELPLLEVSLSTRVRIRSLESPDRKQMMTVRSDYKRAAKGDIAYNMMRMWQGAVGVTPVDGLVSPAYVVASPRYGTDPRYFSALFRTSAYMAEVDKHSRGIVKDRNRLYWIDFKQMPSPYPPPEEQSAIAGFLERAARHVRHRIQSIQRQIELLNEYRTRLIADVVTGKLDVREAASGLANDREKLEVITGLDDSTVTSSESACNANIVTQASEA